MGPLQSFARVLGYVLAGWLRFPRQRVGETLTMDDGRRFTVFRRALVTPNGYAPAPEAIFRVRFHLTGMSPAVNKLFSWLPVPFFTGLPGFRAKFWTLDEASGDFQGLYAWQTLADAEAYAHSFAMRFMTGRAVLGSVSYEIMSAETEAGMRWRTLLMEVEV